MVHNSLGGAYLNVINGNVNLCQSCHIPGGSASAKALINSDEALPWPGSGLASGAGRSHRWDSGVAGHVAFLGGAATASTGTVKSTGTFTGAYAKVYTLTVTTSGSSGAARFDWIATSPGDGSGANLLTGTSGVALDEGVSVVFLGGTDSSFQTNDRWEIFVRPGLRMPVNPAVSVKLTEGQMMCSTCHNPHSQQKTPFDPSAPPYVSGSGQGRHYQVVDNNTDQFCLDCHAARNVAVSSAGSHPVGVAIPATAYFKNPSSLPLAAGTNTVVCQTCHAVHYSASNDGSLSRLDNPRALCTDCHTLADTASPAVHFNVATSALWPGGQYGSLFPAITGTSFRGSCENCHWAHGWPDATASGTTYPKLLVDAEENVCFTCHDADGPAAKAPHADFAKLRHHPVNDSEQRPSREVECTSCHNPHQAIAGVHDYNATATSTRNLASNVLRGADGVAVTYSGTNFETIPSGAYTYIPKSSGVTYEYQVCFKCHSSYFASTPPAGITPVFTTGSASFTASGTTVSVSGATWVPGMVGLWIYRASDPTSVYRITAATSTTATITPAYTGTTATNVAYVMSGETDVAQEFSPKNKSGHPIYTGLNNYTNSSAPKALAAGALKAPWNVNVGTQTMMCSDCHNTDASSPAAQGPHGSAAQYMLRGPNAANWPRVTLANFSTSWCANCHNDLAGDPHTTGDHRTSTVFCYTCHITVPHGGKMSRLMADRDGTMPARYAYGNNKNNVGIMRFTKASSTGAYTESNNCQTSCGHHGSGVGVENW